MSQAKTKLIVGEIQLDSIFEALEIARASYEGVLDDAEWVAQERKFSKVYNQLQEQVQKQYMKASA